KGLDRRHHLEMTFWSDHFIHRDRGHNRRGTGVSFGARRGLRLRLCPRAERSIDRSKRSSLLEDLGTLR
ncbi:MAG: hypothetical protein AAFX94_17350, partial [Myxococcota bacterium]